MILIPLSIIFLALGLFTNYKVDHDFMSIKIYQKNLEKIKLKGLSYDDYMIVYNKTIKNIIMGFYLTSAVFFIIWSAT